MLVGELRVRSYVPILPSRLSLVTNVLIKYIKLQKLDCCVGRGWLGFWKARLREEVNCDTGEYRSARAVQSPYLKL
jgi:hypothetical protein